MQFVVFFKLITNVDELLCVHFSCLSNGLLKLKLDISNLYILHLVLLLNQRDVDAPYYFEQLVLRFFNHVDEHRLTHFAALINAARPDHSLS